MSEYSFNNMNATDSHTSDSKSAANSTNSVSGASYSGSTGFSSDFGFVDNCTATNCTDRCSSYTGNSSSTSFGSTATNSVDSGTCHSLQGVDCKATNCRYHHPGGECSATSITVQAPNAQNKSETFCSTFTPNTGY